MKLNKSSQLLLVCVAALLVSTLLAACGTLTVDFVFVACSKAAGSNNYGEIDVMEVNSESGFLRPIPTSPFPSGGRNPVAEVVSPDGQYLYVVNHDDNSIVQFLIGSDGKLYAQSTINTPGIYPVGLAIDPAEQFLYVIDTYQPLPTCSDAAPCAGSVAVFPILPGVAATSTSSGIPAGSLGSPVLNPNTEQPYWPLAVGTDIVNPTAVNLLANGSDLYISAVDSTITAPATTTAGYLFAFSTSASGTLTALNGGVPYQVGIKPSAITSSNNATIFVADGLSLAAATNGDNVYTFSVGAGGDLTAADAYAAGNQPTALAADPTGSYLYVANSGDSTVSAFTISGSSLSGMCEEQTIPPPNSPPGTPTTISIPCTYATSTEPVAILIDPRFGHYVYTANFLGNGINGTVSGFEIELNPPSNSGIPAGSLVNTQATPYIVNAQPTAMAAVKHNGQ